MVFPTVRKVYWRTCWKPRTVAHAKKDEILEQGPKKPLGHWFTKTPSGGENVKSFTLCFSSVNRIWCPKIHLWTLHPPIPKQGFQFDLFRSPEALAPDPRVRLCVAHGSQIWRRQIWLQFIKQKVDYIYDLQLIMDGSPRPCVCVCDPNRCVEKYEKLNGGRPRSTSCVAVIQSSLENVLVPALPCGVDLQPGTQRQAFGATCRPHFSDLI